MLLLDEPTNHLDLAATEWLESHLLAFPGAMIIVSHDRYLLDAVTTISLLDVLPQVREQNPIAAAAFAAGPHVAATLKVLVVVQVAATAQVLRRLGAEWAGRLLFAAMAAVGAWGVGTAFGVLLASIA